MFYTVFIVPPSPPRLWRGCLSSERRREDLSCTYPLGGAVLQKPETGSCKTELGFTMRLGAQVHRSPQRNFSSHLARGSFKP
ncbi:unnamed protein product, partial [Staurois parvus]